MKTRHFNRIGNGGIAFTELGFGTAPLGNLYRAVSDDDANATLEAAWQVGCRYYDTAPLYGLGLSETRLNPFLRSKKRDDSLRATALKRRLSAPTLQRGIGDRRGSTSLSAFSFSSLAHRREMRSSAT